MGSEKIKEGKKKINRKIQLDCVPFWIVPGGYANGHFLTFLPKVWTGCRWYRLPPCCKRRSVSSPRRCRLLTNASQDDGSSWLWWRWWQQQEERLLKCHFIIIITLMWGTWVQTSDHVEVRGQLWELTLECSYTWKGPKVPCWIRTGEMALWVEVLPSGVWSLRFSNPPSCPLPSPPQ